MTAVRVYDGKVLTRNVYLCYLNRLSCWCELNDACFVPWEPRRVCVFISSHVRNDDNFTCVHAFADANIFIDVYMYTTCRYVLCVLTHLLQVWNKSANKVLIYVGTCPCYKARQLVK